jgi:hypothetical protein
MSHQRIQAQRGQIKPLSAKATLEGVNDDICGFFFPPEIKNVLDTDCQA